MRIVEDGRVWTGGKWKGKRKTILPNIESEDCFDRCNKGGIDDGAME